MTFINKLSSQGSLYELKGVASSKKDESKNQVNDSVTIGSGERGSFINDLKSLQYLNGNKND